MDEARGPTDITMSGLRHAAAPAPAGAFPWMVGDKCVGMYVPATQIISALPNICHAKLESKKIRQFGRNQEDPDGNDVSGFVSATDAAAAMLFDQYNNGSSWSHDNDYINVSNAPSLTHVASGQPQVTLIKLTCNIYHLLPVLEFDRGLIWCRMG